MNEPIWLQAFRNLHKVIKYNCRKTVKIYRDIYKEKVITERKKKDIPTFPLKNNPKKPKICIFEKINQAVKTLSNWPGNQKRKHNLLHVRNVVV